MNRFTQGAVTASLIGLAALGATDRAAAQCNTATANTTVLVSTDINVATTWTAGNTYELTTIVYVNAGASLTIEAGTVIASDFNGVLVVARGAQIHALGNTDCPIVFTSKADRATWTNGDPRTGSWRPVTNEWGNLTLLGRGFLSENEIVGNTPTPSSTNVALMEGLTAGEPRNFYGGGDDDDDSGTIKFLQLRFGGQQPIAPTVELNGLSLGATGRETDISYVEVMNNLDDAIEIWGGTTNLKFVSVWNTGDDSFDIDQGWRGKVQYMLLVQGYSDITGGAAQGSGIGDNMFEMDGAEDCYYQPWTTASFYNVTVIGQPISGDQGTAWRDFARAQFRNCIFMDLGERLVHTEGGGDGTGYGCLADGTDPTTAIPTWAQMWTLDWNGMPAYPPSDPSPTIDPTVTLTSLYANTFTDGKLAEMRNCIFFRNTFGGAGTPATVNDAAYTEANNRGVFNPGLNNVLIPSNSFIEPNPSSPIQSIVRSPTAGPLNMFRVLTLDPRPKNQATTSSLTAPEDGFFTAAPFVGAFPPSNSPDNWLVGWTSTWAWGMTVGNDASVGITTCYGDGSSSQTTPCGCDNLGGPGQGCAHGLGSGVGAKLTASGNPSISNDTLVLTATEVSNQPGLFFQGNNSINNGKGVAFGDGLRCCAQNLVRIQVVTTAGPAVPGITRSTTVAISDVGPNATNLNAGDTRCYQYWYRTPGTWNKCGSTFNLSNSAIITWLP